MYLESNCWTYLLGTKLPPKPSLSGSQTLHSFQFRDKMPVAMEELVDELGAAFDARYSIEQMFSQHIRFTRSTVAGAKECY